LKFPSTLSSLVEYKQKAITAFTFRNSHFRNLVISVLVFSLLFTGVLVFSGNHSDLADQDVSIYGQEAAITAQANNLVSAYGLYIDGSFIAAAENKETIDSALDILLNAKVASLPITNITSYRLRNDVIIEEGEFNPQYIADEATLYKLLGMENEYSFTFVVKSITGEAIDCKLSAEVKATGTKTVEIPYDTDYVDTDLRVAGYEKVVTAGANGVGIENYAYVYHDDVLVEETYLSTEVIEKPTNEIVERGALNADKTVNSLGILASPYHGRISSGYGYREDGFHDGIDIIAISGSCYGHDVYAAMNGTVIQACYSSGLGNNVKIDNGNGIIITYAHLSKILVTKGQTVKTGDVVGQIGATGRATGPHLHFSVEDHGKSVNPLLYLDLDK